MNLEMLCKAAQETQPWMDQFRGRTYAQAFQAYSDRFGGVYLEAVREAGKDESSLRNMAEGILDGIEAGWKHQRPWNRSAARVMEKQMMVDYLSPMLLRQETEGCRILCGLLRDGWAARWPKDAYKTTTYEKLLGGFRNTFMGIELPKRRQESEKE